MITRSYDTFLYAENHLEGQTAKKRDTIDFCSFRLQKVKVRIEASTSEPPICLFCFVCLYCKNALLETCNFDTDTLLRVRTLGYKLRNDCSDF